MMRYALLRGRIISKFKTHADFARAIAMSPASLSAKLNGRTEWTAAEIVRACEVLCIPLAYAHEYFFCIEC